MDLNPDYVVESGQNNASQLPADIPPALSAQQSGMAHNTKIHLPDGRTLRLVHAHWSIVSKSRERA